MSDEAGDQLWRDPDGVVHVAVGTGQLPEPVAAAIVGYLDVSEWDEALRRLDELRDLLDSWHDAALEEAAESLDVALGDACEPVDDQSRARPINSEVASALEPLRAEPAIGRRLAVLDEAVHFVDEWLSYDLDPEKLIGHLS